MSLQPRLAALLTSLALAAVVAACGCGSKPAATTTPPGGMGHTGDDVGSGSGSDSGSAAGSGGEAAMDLSKLGSDCGDDDRCEVGACVKYYGIAGAGGPQFKSCEVACPNGKGPCPAGTTCTTIADGPGAVCRPANPER
ncbi:MAG TPA: hypothetical protein VHE35_01305 [Kofleriaceae bacterium]|nr:hypothetical protein [Kofleriaceae bacterium]